MINFSTRFIVFFVLLLMNSVSFAGLNQEYSPVTSDIESRLVSAEKNYLFLVAEAEPDTTQESLHSDDLPAPSSEDEDAEKKCMKICSQWGEDCIVNPKTGARKCRKVCEHFGEECF